MLVFIDTEFTNFNDPQLISIGLAAEDGRDIYLEWQDISASKCSPFVRQHVLPLLGRLPSAVCSKFEMAQRISDWLLTLPSEITVVYDDEVDWYLFSEACTANQSAKAEKKLPANIRDHTLLGSWAIHDAVFKNAHKRAYTQEWPRHHSLADARALRASYLELRSYLKTNY